MIKWLDKLCLNFCKLLRITKHVMLNKHNKKSLKFLLKLCMVFSIDITGYGLSIYGHV